MASGYAVVVEAIEASARAARRTADRVRPVDLAGALAEVGRGLPGGASAEAARLLADRWGRELPAWVRNVESYGEDLADAARRYRADDAAAARDLRAVPVSGGRRPV
ncbi:hypothetical protein [Amycolatopsis samaneae]|uniref:Excreted virulence factor EspC, type VII ESX diderm n=1 Tax=Amycolatopsis samaneae TaxID=664691 RepID=A0ABW5G9N0_9PSEU